MATQRHSPAMASMWRGLVWLPLALAMHMAPSQAQTEPALTKSRKLSDWLLSQPQTSHAYPLGLVWSTPEEWARQTQLHSELLQTLHHLPIGNDRQDALRRNLLAMPATGRRPLAAADADWLQVAQQRDPLLQAGDAVSLPTRPSAVRVMLSTGQVCELTHHEGLLTHDYVNACQTANTSSAAWLVQPDGRVQEVGLAPWNPVRQDQPAPGAWVWAPEFSLSLPLSFNRRWAQWLSYQGVSTRMDGAAFAQFKQVPLAAPAPTSDPWDMAGRQFQPKPSASNWGNVGLLQMPSARMRSAGHFGLSFHRLSPLNLSNVMLQPMDWLEGGFRYVDVENRLYGPQAFSGDLPYKDKSFDMKLRAVQEGNVVPELAVGWRDMAGTGLYSSEYVVASKRTGRLDWTLGLGWGYLGGRGDVRSPLGRLLGSNYNLRESDLEQGGTFSAKSWFRGDAAVFGGVEYQSPWKTVFKIEYDGNHYQNEPQSNNLPQKSPLNLGLVYQAFHGLDVSLGFERGTTWGVGFTFYTDMAGLAVTKVSAPKPPAVSYTRPVQPPNWQQTAKEIDILTLWQVDKIEQRQDTLTLTATESSHPYTQERLNKALAVLHRDAPKDIDTLQIQHLAMGGVLATQTVNRQAWVDQQTGPARVQDSAPLGTVSYGQSTQIQTDRSATEAASAPNQLLYNHGDFSARLGPDIDYLPFLGGPNGYIYQLRAAAKLTVQLPWDLRVKGTAAQRLLDNYDTFTTPGSGGALPRVRTYLREYLITSHTTLENLSLSKSQQLGNSWYGSLYTGYFESMFGGVGGELLYRQAGSTWALGLDVNRVQQRNFAQDLGFQPETYNTGHLTAYWITPVQGVQASLSVGQYLAGDQGATISLSKTFANGSTMGGYMTKTNVSAQEFGEGSFDKGIFWSIPFEAFLTNHSRFFAGFAWQPLTRDGGARLTRPVNLFAMSRWTGSDAQAYSPAPPWPETVAPDDLLEPWQRPR